MRVYCLSIVAALALSACGEEAAAPEPARAALDIDEPLPVMGPERVILAFGDSLFAGYNVGPGESFIERMENSLRAQGINARLVDGAVSGDTSAAALQRLTFLLDNIDAEPELAIVELGGNDLLRSLVPEETRANIGAVLEELDRRGIAVLLMGMRAPPNLGQGFQTEFDALYAGLAREHDVALVPFFLEPIYDKPDLLQADHVHPTARGIEELVADTVDDVMAALPEND